MTTPTPRTDAEEGKTGDDFYLHGYVEADFARQLERDLAAAQEELRHYRAGRVEMQAQINEAEQKAFQAENSAAAAKEARQAAEQELSWRRSQDAERQQAFFAMQEARQAAEQKFADERAMHGLTIKRADEAQEALKAAEAHEAETHRTLGAILGTDDSLEQCAKRLLERAQAAEARAKRAEERLEWALEPHRPDSINASLVREIQRAEALAESYRKDAERYRLIRDHDWQDERLSQILFAEAPADWDRMLDELRAAIAGEPK